MAAAINSIDLNSDLGEGYGPWRMGDDTAMLSIVTSANVACGGHASDPDTMFQTLSLAREQSVVVGARVRAAAGLTQKALACQAGLRSGGLSASPSRLGGFWPLSKDPMTRARLRAYMCNNCC